MHRNSRDGSRISPYWIENGGHFHNTQTDEFIGWSPDLANRNYYVPDSVTTYTQAELTTYVQGLHAVLPYTDSDGNTLTDAEVATLVTDWIGINGT